jgi:hypothetical protein
MVKRSRAVCDIKGVLDCLIIEIGLYYVKDSFHHYNVS